jgi:glycosyltransferase involved in cell wall biosynthesis
MLVLSNSLTQMDDEGSLKLASSIVKRLKRSDKECFIVSFEREFPQSDIHLQLNKFHLSRELAALIRKKKQSVLYIPFPAPMLSMVLRIWLLSWICRYGLKVMMIRRYPMNMLERFLLRLSGAELVVFSQDARDYYRSMVGKRVQYLKTGVDTEKFVPVSDREQRKLKQKYGFDPDRPLILHVGHMKQGRNIAQLMKIDPVYQVLLVISSLSKERQDENLRQTLTECENIRIIDYYLPDIQEVYQMCDLYFFPVLEQGHCIDVPLSCLEAASCGKPVLTTDYGEMKTFRGKNGFVFIDDFRRDILNERICHAMTLSGCEIRREVLHYDWNQSVSQL